MKQRKLILHAGQHKTGTSAIQDYLFREFTHPDIEYIHANVPNASLWMLQAFKRNLTDRPGFSHLKALDEKQVQGIQTGARDKLERAIRESEKPTHILSAEAFSLFKIKELSGVLEFVSPFYQHIDIHVYFRSLKSRMESAFQEKLKHRFSPIADPFRLDYRRAVEMLDKVFGQDHVFVHKYDKRIFPAGSVVEDFLCKIGCEASVDKPVQVNTGLSLDAVKLLYVYRTYYAEKDSKDASRIRILGQLQGNPFRFHSALFNQRLVTRENSIRDFEERAGFSLDEDIASADDYGVQGEQDLYAIPQSAIAWLQSHSHTMLDSAYEMKDIATSVRHLVDPALTD